MLYITKDFPDITTVRLGGHQVPSSKIGSLRKIIIWVLSSISDALKYLGPLLLKKDFLNLCTVQ